MITPQGKLGGGHVLNGHFHCTSSVEPPPPHTLFFLCCRYFTTFSFSPLIFRHLVLPGLILWLFFNEVSPPSSVAVSEPLYFQV